MYAPPTDVEDGQIVETLAANWDLAATTITYAPVGFGTHHYVALDTGGERWFVNVDDLTADGVAPEAVFDRLARAFGTARAIHDNGLEFVLSPIATPDGRVVVRLGDRYAVSVVPYLDGSSNEFGEFTSNDQRRSVLMALGRIHSTSVPDNLPSRETFEIPLRARLFDALNHHLGESWGSGPFGEACRDLLIEHATSVRQRFDHYDSLVVGVSAEGWVVTHGEPHAANVMRPAEGSLVLIDWDTAAVAPRERDLWMVEPRNSEDWDAYTSGGGVSTVDGQTIELYKLSWDLTEIAIYTDVFRGPHVEDANTLVSWKGFQEYLSGS